MAEGHVDSGRCFTDLESMLATVSADALLACPIIAAHGWAVRTGLEAGLHVLVEKPFVTELEEARELAELSEATGRLLGVVQNWRTRSAGQALKRALDEQRIGAVSHVVFRYLRDREQPHLPDYLFDEPDPILWAMGVHHLDLFRYVLGEEIVRVEGRATRPSWSRYRVPSINDLWLETESGLGISYVASFSSRNAHIPQESLQVEGELGTIYNDSDYFEPPLWLSLRGAQGDPIDLTAEVAPRRPRLPGAVRHRRYRDPAKLPRRRDRARTIDRLRARQPGHARRDRRRPDRNRRRARWLTSRQTRRLSTCRARLGTPGSGAGSWTPSGKPRGRPSISAQSAGSSSFTRS